MANTTIDTLEVKIKASATDASSALERLATSLKHVKSALSATQKDGITVSQKISRSITDLNNALNGINTSGLSKLNALSSAINNYADAISRIKKFPAGGISQSVSDANKSISDKIDTSVVSPEQSELIKENSAAVNKLHDKMEGLGKSVDRLIPRIKQANKHLKKTNEFFGKFTKSIGRIAFYRAIRSALKAVTEAFTEGLKNAYLYSQQTEGFERLANALDRLKSITSQMVNQLGAFWGEFRQFIQPAIEWLIEKVRQLSELLTEFFAGLNGSNVYQYALLEDLKWQEATEDLKKYKHQLLGLDELNNLADNQRNSKDENDATTKYELRPVRESFQNIGKAWQSVKTTIEDAYKEIGDLAYLPIGMLALGSILLFTGHPLLGIALVMKGVQWAVEAYTYNNEENKEKIQGFFEEYRDLFDFGSAAAVAIGTMLLFIPGHRALGLGLIMGGVMLKNLVHDNVKFSWGGLLKTINGKFDDYRNIFSEIGRAAVAIGTMLLFIPGKVGLGLGLILAGTSVDGLASAKEFSWGELLTTIQNKFDEYRDIFNTLGTAAVAIGAMLLFVPGMMGIGLGLITKGTGVLLLANSEDIDFSAPLESLKTAWRNIEAWWKGTVQTAINTAINWIEDKLHFDINGDKQIAGLWEKDYTIPSNGQTRARNVTGYGEVHLRGKEPTVSDVEKEVAVTIQGTLGTWAADSLKDAFTDTVDDTTGFLGTVWSNIKNSAVGEAYEWLKDKITPKAAGGVVGRGSLFYAGEAGAEFVGNIGNTSAVANTDQMTDAIYKAAYMGMSRALQENGGNGMSGFVPATTDDLFIAMRKKASNYNKATGNSAFA